jgi:hypothetical protein
MLDTYGGALTPVRTSAIGDIGGICMKTYEFDVVLKGVGEITDEQADTLFSAGCDDGTPASSAGAAWIHFDRDADSLETAIRSAVAQVQSAGFVVARVELDANAAVGEGI